MKRGLRIASVCRELPNPGDPSVNVFVLRRLEAMAKLAAVETIQPVAYFPVLKPFPVWAYNDRPGGMGVTIHPERMFYVPKVLKSLDGQWLRRAVARGLRRLGGRARVDVVDAHFGYPEGVGSFLAARSLRIPVFITLRGFEVEYLRKPIIGPQIARALRLVDGCICVSHTLRRLALEQGVAPEKATVIHNAVDGEIFHPGDRQEHRKRLGWPPEGPVIVSVGHLISRKRHHVLIAAFADVLDRFPTAKLVIIGGQSFEGAYPRALRAQVAQLGIGNSVTFAGNLRGRDVADRLRAADVFALATQREGCCNAVLEALATGLPVVTTPVGDNGYFVKHGSNGFVVPVDDALAMGRALIQALEAPAWDRDAIAGSLGVGDWGRVAAQVLDFFDARISSRGGRAETVARAAQRY